MRRLGLQGARRGKAEAEANYNKYVDSPLSRAGIARQPLLT